VRLTLLTFVYCAFDMIQLKRYIYSKQKARTGVNIYVLMVWCCLYSDQVFEKYLKELESNVESTRCGFALALGAMPRFMLASRLGLVISGLVSATSVAKKQQAFAESRRDAVKALTRYGAVSRLSLVLNE